jgi:hypothetical protein
MAIAQSKFDTFIEKSLDFLDSTLLTQRKAGVFRPSLLVALTAFLMLSLFPVSTFASTSTVTAPVSFTVSPNPVRGAAGSHVPVTVTWTNTGTTFVAKNCIAYFSTHKSGPWTKGTGCFLSQPFPYTVNHGKTTEHLSQYIASHLTGTVYFKVTATGTYGGVSAQSKYSYFTVVVT